jgi:acyl carrier protein
MEHLIEELKQGIVERLKLPDVDWQQIDSDAPIFIDGLGLDSIDALELLVLIDQKYGLKVASSEEGKRILYSVRTMAEFIAANRKD